MFNLPRCVTFILIFLSGAILAACESTPEITPVCPKVVPLEQGGSLTRFLPGPGRDITDITLEAEFNRVAGNCKVFKDEIEVGVMVELIASQGPAMQSDTADASLLIFILGADKKLIKRREFPLKFIFPDNQSIISYTERFLLDIPKSMDQNGDAFLVYLSFRLTPRELQFNREKNLF